MSITPKDLFDWALCHPTTSECDHRVVVSRAYYAAYHDCQLWHANLPEPGSVQKSGGVHHELFERLSNPAPGLSQGKASRKRAYALRELHGLRVNADYELGQEAPDATDAVTKAARIIAIH